MLHTIEKWARIVTDHIHPVRDTPFKEAVAVECERRYSKKLKDAVFLGTIPFLDPIDQSPFNPATLHVAFVPDGLIRSDDLRNWLEDAGIAWPGTAAGESGTAVAETNHASAPPAYTIKLKAQRLAILQWLQSEGYSPHNLPSRAPGKSGVKAMVKAAMLRDASLFTEASFEKAWESLRGGRLN